MSNVKEFLNYVKELKDNEICYLGGIEQQEMRPLLFYHIPKTGGMMFNQVIKNSQKFIRQRTNGVKYNGRVGAIYDLKTKIDRRNFSENHSSILAWYPYGFHSNFKRRFNLVTIVRNSFDRVVSRYKYLVMINEIECSEKAFYDFMTKPNQINHQVALLSGQEHGAEISESHLQTAFKNLENFYAYTIMERYNDLVQSIVWNYAFPNIVGSRINVSKKVAVDFEKFREEGLRLNDFDQSLYEAVLKEDRIPECNYVETSGINEDTLRLYERSESNNFYADSMKTSEYISKTSTVLN